MFEEFLEQDEAAPHNQTVQSQEDLIDASAFIMVPIQHHYLKIVFKSFARVQRFSLLEITILEEYNKADLDRMLKPSVQMDVQETSLTWMCPTSVG